MRKPIFFLLKLFFKLEKKTNLKILNFDNISLVPRESKYIFPHTFPEAITTFIH